MSLWVSAIASEFPSNLWGTYRQWQERDCQVRKGEKASLIVFYKTVAADDRDNESDDLSVAPRDECMVARASWVFNAAQVNGFVSAEESLRSRCCSTPLRGPSSLFGTAVRGLSKVAIAPAIRRHWIRS